MVATCRRQVRKRTRLEGLGRDFFPAGAGAAAGAATLEQLAAVELPCSSSSTTYR
ncbi:MAG: hypothetical protein AB8E82_06925 [Aureispira sp.]